MPGYSLRVPTIRKQSSRTMYACFPLASTSRVKDSSSIFLLNSLAEFLKSGRLDANILAPDAQRHHVKIYDHAPNEYLIIAWPYRLFLAGAGLELVCLCQILNMGFYHIANVTSAWTKPDFTTWLMQLVLGMCR